MTDMKRLLTLLLLLGTGAALLAPAAHAAKFLHGQPRQIKCAVLIIPSSTPEPPRGAIAPAPYNRYTPLGQNLNPYVFYVADERRDLKPTHWEFVNPLAPATVTDQMAVRWAQIQGNVAPLSGRSFVPGTPLTKDMAPYWEAVLAPENLSRLKELDIAYISAATPVAFTLQDSELLRRMADAGVCLWFDNAGGFRIGTNADDPNKLFLPLDFPVGGAGTSATLNTGHPLLSGYYRLSSGEIARLGDGNGYGNRVVNFLPTDSTALEPVLQPILPNGNITTPYLAAARYGSGYVVATAGNVGGAISAPAGPALPGLLGNTGVVSGVTLLQAQVEDLKFFYNIVSWTGEQDQVQRGPRRNGASNEQLTGFVERWRLPAASPSWITPLISHGMVFGATLTQVGYTIHALEANPVDDFDLQREVGNNLPINIDDGDPDLSRGLSYDQIGAWLAPGDVSWMSGLALGEKNGVPILFMTGGIGSDPTKSAAGAFAFAVPTPGNPTLTQIARWDAPPLPPNSAGTGRNIYAPPALFEGVLYAAGGQAEPGAITGSGGEVRALDLRPNGQFVEQWHYPQGNAYTSIGPIVGAPAVGYVEDTRTGAIDLSCFFTTLQSAASPGGLGGLVISTHAEPLSAVNDNRTWQPSRRTENWDPQRWWDIRVIDNNTGLTFKHYFLGDTRANNNSAQVQFNVDNQAGRIRLPEGYDPAQFSVAADYTLQGDPDVNTIALKRRHWMPTFNTPGVQPQPTGIAAGPVIGKDDLVYYATGNGYIAAAQFAGNQGFVRWKARIPGADQFTAMSQVVYPGDPSRLQDYAFTASPAVSNDLVYFAGRDGAVYAFEANPTFSFKVPETPGKRPMHSARAAQTVVYSNEGQGGPRTNRLPPGSFSVDAESGTVTIHDFRNLSFDLNTIERDNSPGRQGSLQTFPELGNRPRIKLDVDYINDLGQNDQETVSLPVHIVYSFTTGIGTAFRDKDRFSSSPVVLGDSVYVTGESGLIYELPADPRREDPEFRMGTELATYLNGTFVRAKAVSPPGSGGPPLLASPAVANGLVAMALPTGLTAFQSPSVLVADANRIVEFGGSGDTLSTMDATVKHTLTGLGGDFPIPTDPLYALVPNAQTQNSAIITQRQFIDHPTRVRHLSRGSTLTSIFFSAAPTEPGIVSEHSELADESNLIADTGNNRIVEVNPAGKVVWEAKSFQDPFRLLPSGESLTLLSPRDVQRWVDTEADPNGGPALLVIHTLIADTGNTRVIELVDKIRYRQGNYTGDSYVQIPGQLDRRAGDPVRWYHVLVWTSQTNAQGLKLAYQTAQRVPLVDGTTGQPVPNPGVDVNIAPRPVLTREPFLPAEPFQMTTMASVANLRVRYEMNPSSPNYGFTQRNIPQAVPGGDTVLFLRSNRTDPIEPIRGADPATPNNPDRLIYVQGTVDQTLPTITDIWDFDASGKNHIIKHTLQGVQSVQRTVRYDHWVDTANPPGNALNPSFGEGGAIWYLIADQGGVFEVRFDTTIPVPANSVADPRARLAWAFTNDDYNWVTGGGVNGDPTTLRDNQNRYVSGRLFTASSAQHLASGQVLIVSRTAPNPQSTVPIQGAGGDIFILRPSDYNPFLSGRGDGYRQDQWVQRALPGSAPLPPGLPSITWRAPAPRNPLLPPGLDPALATFNPLETRGTYAPEVPVFADLIF
jgi:PQQ-like domain